MIEQAKPVHQEANKVSSKQIIAVLAAASSMAVASGPLVAAATAAPNNGGYQTSQKGKPSEKANQESSKCQELQGDSNGNNQRAAQALAHGYDTQPSTLSKPRPMTRKPARSLAVVGRPRRPAVAISPEAY